MFDQIRSYILNSVWESSGKVLSYPIVLLLSVLHNIYRDFSFIFENLSGGKAVPFGVVGDLFKWVLLVAIIIVVIWRLIRFTIERAMPESLKAENILTVFGNLIYGIFIIALFYVIVAIVLYTFSYYLSVIKAEIEYKPQHFIILK